MGVTKKAFAAQLGVDPHHISKLVQAEMPTRWDDRIDAVPALSWMLANARRGSRVNLAAMNVACGLVDAAE